MDTYKTFDEYLDILSSFDNEDISMEALHFGEKESAFSLTSTYINWYLHTWKPKYAKKMIAIKKMTANADLDAQLKLLFDAKKELMEAREAISKIQESAAKNFAVTVCLLLLTWGLVTACLVAPMIDGAMTAGVAKTVTEVQPIANIGSKTSGLVVGQMVTKQVGPSVGSKIATGLLKSVAGIGNALNKIPAVPLILQFLSPVYIALRAGSYGYSKGDYKGMSNGQNQKGIGMMTKQMAIQHVDKMLKEVDDRIAYCAAGKTLQLNAKAASAIDKYSDKFAQEVISRTDRVATNLDQNIADASFKNVFGADKNHSDKNTHEKDDKSHGKN